MTGHAKYDKAKEKEIIKSIKQFYHYDDEYLGAFTKWVSEWMKLDTFPSFLSKKQGVLTEVACGSCLRCLLQYKVFESLEEISYDISINTKTIFPVTILQDLVNNSEAVFDKIEKE